MKKNDISNTKINKPYKIRELKGEDFFTFAVLVNKLEISKIYDLYKNVDEKISQKALNIAFAIIIFKSILNDVICSSKDEILKFLESISDLSVDKLKVLPLADFGDMVMDVVEHPSILDFIERMFSRIKNMKGKKL